MIAGIIGYTGYTGTELLKILLGKKYLVSTRVVKSDYKQRVKPKQLQYSVIDKILKVY